MAQAPLASFQSLRRIVSPHPVFIVRNSARCRVQQIWGQTEPPALRFLPENHRLRRHIHCLDEKLHGEKSYFPESEELFSNFLALADPNYILCPRAEKTYRKVRCILFAKLSLPRSSSGKSRACPSSPSQTAGWQRERLAGQNDTNQHRCHVFHVIQRATESQPLTKVIFTAVGMISRLARFLQCETPCHLPGLSGATKSFGFSGL